MQRGTLATELVELVGHQARRAVASVRDPRAKALRRRRRARRALALRSGVALVAGTVTAVIGTSSGLELSEVGAGAVTVLAAVGAGVAGVRCIRLWRSPLPAAHPPPSPPLPPPGSAAREPLARLAVAEAGLADVLAVLSRPRHGVPLVAAETIESTRAAAAEAGSSLRGTAEAIRAVERAAALQPAAAEPPEPPEQTDQTDQTDQRAGLLDAVAALRRQLDEGVDEICALVAAAGAVVSAAGPHHRPAALAEATDRLTGLAVGLRELS
ncbi:MAG TPA: hypothetical protein VGI84_09220 [Pseudonocardiaceae bacterium]